MRTTVEEKTCTRCGACNKSKADKMPERWSA
jgi:ferredoxin